MKRIALREYILELAARIQDEKEYLKVLEGSAVLEQIKGECEAKIKDLKEGLRFAVKRLRGDEMDFYEDNWYKLEGYLEEDAYKPRNYAFPIPDFNDNEPLPFDPEKKKAPKRNKIFVTANYSREMEK